MVADDYDLPDVRALDATAESCLAAGDLAQAMLCWERSLFLRQHYLGYESPEVWALAKRMCAVATDVGRRQLCAGRLDDARCFLLKADALATTADEYIAIFNQLAAYYRRVHKLRVAYSYLQRAMALDGSSGLRAAETRLNACAILSQLGRHDKALLAAQRALILLQEAGNAPDAHAHAHWSAVAVAYHNMAVELEFLKKPHVQVLQSYKRAVQTACDRLGIDDPLTTALEEAQRAAESLVARKKTHDVFREARAKASSRPAEPKSRGRRHVPKQTTAAYGVRPLDASGTSDVLAPKGPGVDLCRFDARALADDFVLPEPVVRMPLPASSDLTPLLTPRRSEDEPATSNPVGVEKIETPPPDDRNQGFSEEPELDAKAGAAEETDINKIGGADESIAEAKTMDDVATAGSDLRRLSLDMPLDESEAKAADDMLLRQDEKHEPASDEPNESRQDEVDGDGIGSDADVRSDEDDDGVGDDKDTGDDDKHDDKDVDDGTEDKDQDDAKRSQDAWTPEDK
ncbi:hypothetical protein SDRG_05016 [Saprolegnia diclina VS20]|uniref:Uncharacterized protein n=1 Tax=Saprolegnia diclina (strain VS20) TaxID=1156394 RepID=T0S3R6_SAPDV|nr:hypothetical protein SDRG_05016 [Saprolegnia diclina VS20]EQC37412.1 hypothetical protein SDRG_05016 [Saprolegnia diclina VS20]|eukprot:XP_008608932.1 hypothetical protein SDRG_05016 [Saprolegnia diclina VS20]